MHLDGNMYNNTLYTQKFAINKCINRLRKHKKMYNTPDYTIQYSTSDIEQFLNKLCRWPSLLMIELINSHDFLPNECTGKYTVFKKIF